MNLILLIFIPILFVLLFLTRLIYLLYIIRNKKASPSILSKQKTELKTMIVIGSGGHTTEMIRILHHLNLNLFQPRIYIIANSDYSSLYKIMNVELNNPLNCSEICKIPRSRQVHQSYLSSVFTSMYCIFYCIPLMFKHKPDVILCNGPGTCIPVCFVAFVMKCLFISKNTVIIFIESICRVYSLSLTGKLLINIADQFIVQWPELKQLYKTTDLIY